MSGLGEINLIDHPFKRKLFLSVKDDYTKFDYRYFDDPTSLTGFRGFYETGNKAEGRRDFMREAMMIASIPKVETVLDVGCAKGFLVRDLRKSGIHAYGIDVSEYALSDANPEIKPYLQCMRVQDLRPGERYDIVHVNGVFVYLEISEIVQVLKILFQITKLGVIIIEPTREQILEWYERGDVSALDPLRKQEISQEDWDALIEKTGFHKNSFWYKKS